MELENIKKLLGNAGASERAANKIFEIMNES